MKLLKPASGFSSLFKKLATLACLYTCGLAAGLALFASLFQADIEKAEHVLFFRGLELAVLAFALLFAALVLVLQGNLRRTFGIQDAFCAAILSLSFNICFLVLAPVTVDRSVSIFMLGEMAANPDESFSEARMSRLFVDAYVGDYQQIARRLAEQSAIGNIENHDGTYRISARGKRFMAISKAVSWLFGGDPRFVNPPALEDRRLSLAGPR